MPTGRCKIVNLPNLFSLTKPTTAFHTSFTPLMYWVILMAFNFYLFFYHGDCYWQLSSNCHFANSHKRHSTELWDNPSRKQENYMSGAAKIKKNADDLEKLSSIHRGHIFFQSKQNNQRGPTWYRRKILLRRFKMWLSVIMIEPLVALQDVGAAIVMFPSTIVTNCTDARS